MSDPYNQYPQQGQYGQQGYGAPPAPNYGGGYQQPQQGYPPQQDYSQQSYGAPANYGSPQPQSYGAPPPQQYYDQNQPQYGPPATGGFQHGQQPPQQYGQSSYPPQDGQRNEYPGAAPANQYPQQGPYGQAPADPSMHPTNPNYDPNSQVPGGAAEGERGLLGAIGGGVAGYYGGKKMGHGLIGTALGAFGGSKLEDMFKDKKNNHNNGGSSYGGNW